MCKRYIAYFDSKEEMFDFIKTYKDIIKVIETNMRIHYPYPDNWVQYKTIYSLYYEANWEQLIKEK